MGLSSGDAVQIAPHTASGRPGSSAAESKLNLPKKSTDGCVKDEVPVSLATESHPPLKSLTAESPTSVLKGDETAEAIMQAWSREYFSFVPSSEPAPDEFLGEELFEVAQSSKGGMGAFARREIPRGTMILRETPLMRANDGSLLAAFEAISPEHKEKLLELSSNDEIDPSKVVSIYKTNRFRTGRDCSTFYTASRFNHACIPHLHYSWNEAHGQMTFKVEKTIKKGEEITISYGQSAYELFANYGFVCDCGNCDPPRTKEEQEMALLMKNDDYYEDSYGAKRRIDDVGFPLWKVLGAW